ncbi:MAG: rhomboid family intramembrane serine protease [Gammaproteobacteria bacterium]|nr:rhomboid family intramembrane serine protease [Gammaproteobacteria bacterium]
MISIRHLPPVTLALVAICVLVALASGFGQGQKVLQPLYISARFLHQLPEVKSGEYWRLLTPIFIHYGFIHLGLNMFALWILGRAMEIQRRSLSLIILVIVTGVVSNLAELWESGPRFGGMSGVLYGLFGYLWMQGRFNPKFGIHLPHSLINALLIWFVICWSGIFEYLLNVRFANMSHTAGLVTGIIWGFVSAKMESASLKKV